MQLDTPMQLQVFQVKDKVKEPPVGRGTAMKGSFCHGVVGQHVYLTGGV